jgi:hypothetical protein
VDGETHEIRPEDWFGFRDHSWGVRQSVGAAPTDLIPSKLPVVKRLLRGAMKWTPSFFRRPDGTYYETAIFLVDGVFTYSSAYINDADGSQERVRSVRPDIDYDSRNRFVRGGTLHLTMESGTDRLIEFEALGESGFFLKTAGYGSWAGTIHGSWHGALHVDGEHIGDCWDDEHLRSLGQFRDTPIRVREGDAVGFGIMESLINGPWPELGLSDESDHPQSYS